MRYNITIDGRTFEVEVDRDNAMLLDEYAAFAPTAPTPAESAAAAPASEAPAVPAGAAAAPSLAAGETVNAPLPGTVLRVNVSQNQAVKAGDVLVILEAMKMENEIVAPRDGTVVQIVTPEGSQVETGAPLLVLA